MYHHFGFGFHGDCGMFVLLLLLVLVVALAVRK